MKTHIHVCQLSNRTHRVTVDECPEWIELRVWTSYVGPWKTKQDFKAYQEWMLSILLPYENDRRPQRWFNENEGRYEAMIYDLR